jgi:hypothetical protein
MLVFTAGTLSRSPTFSRRRWKRGFWNARATRRAPAQWTTRKLAAHLRISHMMVARVWHKHSLKPHRIERYMASNDPDIEQKGRRHHWPLAEPASSRGGVLCRSKDPYFKPWIAKIQS